MKKIAIAVIATIILVAGAYTASALDEVERSEAGKAELCEMYSEVLSSEDGELVLIMVPGESFYLVINDEVREMARENMSEICS